MGPVLGHWVLEEPFSKRSCLIDENLLVPACEIHPRECSDGDRVLSHFVWDWIGVGLCTFLSGNIVWSMCFFSCYCSCLVTGKMNSNWLRLNLIQKY